MLHEVVQRIQMEEKIFHPIATYSDGQLQPAYWEGLGAAKRPTYFWMNPLLHLDLHHKAQVFGLIKQAVQDAKKTVVFSTHEVNHALQLCTHILLLHKEEGYFGSPQELIAQGPLENYSQIPWWLLTPKPSSLNFATSYLVRYIFST